MTGEQIQDIGSYTLYAYGGVSSDGRYLRLRDGEFGSYEILDLESGRHMFWSQREIYFSPDSRWFIADSGIPTLYQLSDNAVIHQFKCHHNGVSDALVFSDTGRYVANSLSYNVVVWDLEANPPLFQMFNQRVSLKGDVQVVQMAFSETDEWLIGRVEKTSIVGWNIQSGLPMQGLNEVEDNDALVQSVMPTPEPLIFEEFQNQEDGKEYLSLSPDGRMVAIARLDDAEFSVWDTSTLDETQIIPIAVMSLAEGLYNVQMTYNDDGTLLALTTDGDGMIDDTIYIFNVDDLLNGVVEPVVLEQTIASVLFNVDNTIMAVAKSDGIIQLWGIANP